MSYENEDVGSWSPRLAQSDKFVKNISENDLSVFAYISSSVYA